MEIHEAKGKTRNMREIKVNKGWSGHPNRFTGHGSLRALVIAAMAGAIALTSTGCSPVTNAVKGVFVDEGFPTLPTPEVATYIVDLSGSTYPIQQLKALGSGIEDFVSGSSLGDPFRSPKLPPRSLSVQFITQNSANAGRISLISATAGLKLYDFVQRRTPNLDQARPLWEGFVKARTHLATTKVGDLASCRELAIDLFGQQGLSASVLQEPAGWICNDIEKSQAALRQLSDFVARPNVPMGSDVFGAIELAVTNLKRADMQFPMSQKTLVIASDLIDQTPNRRFVKRINSSSSNDQTCELAQEDLMQEYGKEQPFQDLLVVLVGQGNSRADVKLLSEVRKYWTCYFKAAGAEVIQTTDLNNY